MSARALLRMHERERAAAGSDATSSTGEGRARVSKVATDSATRSLLLGIINNVPQSQPIFRFDPFGTPSFEDTDTVPMTSLGYPMSEEGRAAFESLRLIRDRARGVGRWRDDVNIAMGEERLPVYPTWSIKVHEPYLFDFSSVQNTPASSPRPDFTPETPPAPAPTPTFAQPEPVVYPFAQHYNPLLAVGAAPPPVPVSPAAAAEAVESQVGLGIDVDHHAATDESAADPLATLITTLSSPSTSTFSLPSTAGALSWDELTLGTPSPLRTTFLGLPAVEASQTHTPVKAMVGDDFKANPFGFTREMVKGEVLTTASFDLGDQEGRKKVEEERRRKVWKEMCEAEEVALGAGGKSWAEIAGGKGKM